MERIIRILRKLPSAFFEFSNLYSQLKELKKIEGREKSVAISNLIKNLESEIDEEIKGLLR